MPVIALASTITRRLSCPNCSSWLRAGGHTHIYIVTSVRYFLLLCRECSSTLLSIKLYQQGLFTHCCKDLERSCYGQGPQTRDTMQWFNVLGHLGRHIHGAWNLESGMSWHGCSQHAQPGMEIRGLRERGKGRSGIATTTRQTTANIDFLIKNAYRPEGLRVSGPYLFCRTVSPRLSTNAYLPFVLKQSTQEAKQYYRMKEYFRCRKLDPSQILV